MPNVKMNSIQSVKIDGVDVGSLATADKVLTCEEVQEAVVEWHDREKVAAIDIVAKDFEEVVGKVRVELAELKRTSDETIGQLQTMNAMLQNDLLATRKAVASFLGGTSDGKEAQKLYKKILLESQIAKWQNELDDLEGE